MSHFLSSHNSLRSLISGPCVVLSFMPVFWSPFALICFFFLAAFCTHSFSDYHGLVFFNFKLLETWLAQNIGKTILLTYVSFRVASDYRYLTFLLVTETVLSLIMCKRGRCLYILVVGPRILFRLLVIWIRCNFCETPGLSLTAWFLTPTPPEPSV